MHHRMHPLGFRKFSNKQKLTESQFKSFFKLGIKDRPIPLHTRFYFSLRSNRRLRKFLLYSKYGLAIGLLFFVTPGTFLPGQFYCKLLNCHVMKVLYVRNSYGAIVDLLSGGINQDNKVYTSRFIKYLNWKINYLNRNGMLSSELLAQDINQMCFLIDKDGNDIDNLSADNFAINECLAFILHSFLPVVHKQSNLKIMDGLDLQESLLNLIDIINLKCKSIFIIFIFLFRELFKTCFHQTK